MKKVGFIGEGESERIFLSSQAFSDFLFELDLEVVGVFDAGGREHILSKSKKVEDFLKILSDLNAEKIFLLLDLENEKCITACKEKIAEYSEDCIIIISVKAIEAWLLSDYSTMQTLLRGRFTFDEPEKTESVPLEKLKQIFIEKTGNGLGYRKPRIMKRFIKYGFSLVNAAEHPNCSSAKYFKNKLEEFAEEL